MKTKSSAQLTLHDRLSRLTIQQAEKWLGPEGKRLLVEAGKEQLDINPADVSWPDDATFQVMLHPAGREVVVTLTQARAAAGRDGVRWHCSERDDAPAWVALVLAFVLDEKTTLGLAAPPPDEQDLPLELLDEAALERRALAEREQRAREEKMTVSRTANATGPWCDHLVNSALSGKTYRVALRGLARGESFCACPDFRKNTLGTCKHILRVIAWAKKKHTVGELSRAWVPEQLAIHVRYDGEPRLALEIPPDSTPAIVQLTKSWRERFAQTDDETAELFALVQKLVPRTNASSSFPMPRSASARRCTGGGWRVSWRTSAKIPRRIPCGRRS